MCRQESFDERLVRESEEYSQRFCPQRLGRDIVLDSITYSIQTQTRTYHHTLSGELDNRALIQSTSQTFRTEALKTLKNSIDMKTMKDQKINFIYLFRSASTHEILLSTKFTANDY